MAFMLKRGGFRSANSMLVMPMDQISDLPSYCPSSMAKMTSGAILHRIGVIPKLSTQRTGSTCSLEAYAKDYLVLP